jgi:hypothetical protein
MRCMAGGCKRDRRSVDKGGLVVGGEGGAEIRGGVGGGVLDAQLITSGGDLRA